LSIDGESGAPPILSPGDAVDAASAERRLEQWLGIAAAALLHLAIILWLVVEWDLSIGPPEPEAVPVRLVMAPPEPEPPQKYRESGKDEQTTAPPAASEEKTPESAPPPAPLVPRAERVEVEPPPEAPRVPTEAPRVPKRQAEIALARPPAIQRPPVEIEPGDRNLRGDPYFNLLVKLLMSHRVVPRAVSTHGLPLEGVAIYSVIIDPHGNLTDVRLVASSHVPVLDEAGERMIRSAAPFPPPPADFPRTDLPLEFLVPLYSEAP
jgi:periplasmic protein TonB